jgi:hypothetical protein
MLSGAVWRGRLVPKRKSNRTRLTAGVFAAAAVAAPLYGALTVEAPQVSAQPACLAWFGNKDDGKCLSYSNGQPIFVGTPDVGVYGPNAGSMPGGGIGVSTGPLLPGTTINQGIG